MKVAAQLGHPHLVEDGRDRMGAQLAVTTADVELVARCRAGDRSAWKALHDAHYAFVWKVARRLGTPPAEVEDVAQETFMIAFRKLERFEHGHLRTWLYRIAANVVSARHRRRRVRRALHAVFRISDSEKILDRTPHDDVESREAVANLDAILERMSPRKREVLVMFEMEGLSGEEIAARVGCPVDTVWTRLFHARKEFQRIARARGALP